MKKLLFASAAAALAAGAASAQDVKFGVLFGFTGPIESLTPPMADAAELAMQEISDSGAFLGGQTLGAVRGDSTCIDNSAAQAAGERMVTSDGVVAIVGADCSGVTMGVLQNVAVPNGIPMISPSATSPAFSDLEDDAADLFFRTAPSDARQGEMLANVVMDHGYEEVAVTFTNNDYGQGLSDSFVANYEALGGTVTTTVPHQDGRGDYSAEVGTLASAGGELLVVLGYADQGGALVIQNAWESGAFDVFALGDGMFADTLLERLGDALEGTIGTVPWSAGEGTEAFSALAEEAGVNGESTFTRESYDATALLALAAQAAGEATPEGIAANVMNVANAPGEEILPGELGRGLEILADGGEVDYVGATNVEFIGIGEAAGTYREYIVEDGEYTTVQFR
ncbi:branched-chain amino acid ABC transporter substrate-binding protein [Rhodobacteraceae bacterium WD3A24]|nr:branched-chain amino acid ABC transporter substrate-binding protein [Rhodobacteraceae bacterium WD3A24]